MDKRERGNGLAYPSYEMLFNYWVQHSLYEKCSAGSSAPGPRQHASTQTEDYSSPVSPSQTPVAEARPKPSNQGTAREEDYFTRGTSAYFLLKDAIDEEIEKNGLMLKSPELREIRCKRMTSVNKLLDMFGIQRTPSNQRRLNMRIQTLITTRRHQAKLRVAAEHQGISCRQLRLSKRETKQHQQKVYVWKEHDEVSTGCGTDDEQDLGLDSNDSLEPDDYENMDGMESYASNQTYSEPPTKSLQESKGTMPQSSLAQTNPVNSDHVQDACSEENHNDASLKMNLKHSNLPMLRPYNHRLSQSTFQTEKVKCEPD